MVPLARVIPAALAEVIRKAPLCPEKVDFAWREVVGPALARVTRVQLDDRGVLHVTADPRWGREVTRMTKLIVPRLETYLGPGVVERITV